jgi:bacterioferritin-associated ferredoxin
LIFNFTSPTILPSMIVCHCHAVTDRAIRRCVREGACSRAEVSRACRAGTRCGGCHPTIEGILADERAADSSSLASPALASATAS